MFKRFLFFLAVVASFISCTTKNNNSDTTQASEQTAKADLGFLDKLGIKTSQLMTIGQWLDDKWADHTYDLDENQLKALLNDIYHFDSGEEIEGGFYIVGVKPLPGGHTLVLFHVEYGDSGQQEMAIYDSEGHLTDHLNIGSNEQDSNIDANEDMTKGTSERVEIAINFDGDLMTLKRDYFLYSWTAEPDGNPQLKNKEWSISKTYQYGLTADGKFSFKDLKTSKEGNIENNTLLVDEVNDLQMRPASDTRRMDELNTFAGRPEVVADIKAEGSLEWGVESAVWGYFMENPQAVLTWMAGHQDSANQLLTLFKDLFNNGTVNKSILVNEIKKMTDAKARQYLEQLTAQWGPENAEK